MQLSYKSVERCSFQLFCRLSTIDSCLTVTHTHPVKSQVCPIKLKTPSLIFVNRLVQSAKACGPKQGRRSYTVLKRQVSFIQTNNDCGLQATASDQPWQWYLALLWSIRESNPGPKAALCYRINILKNLFVTRTGFEPVTLKQSPFAFNQFRHLASMFTTN